MIKLDNNASFPLGEIVATSNAVEKLPPDLIIQGLMRHAQGDWGEIDPEDGELNNIYMAF